MNKIFLVILIYFLGMVGGTGAYGNMSWFMNLLVITSLAIFSWRVVSTYNLDKSQVEAFAYNKFLVMLLYVGFMTANMLKETVVSTEYMFGEFKEETDTIRQYIDMFRGVLSFLAIGIVFSEVKYNKIFIFLPPICLAIILGSMFLEVYGYISHNRGLEEGAEWGASPQELMLERPGGFMNANMTAAVAMVWLFIALEAQRSSPIIVKGLCLILAVSVCVIAQSRAALLFLVVYSIHSLLILRRGGFLVSLLIGCAGAVFILSYLDMDIVTGIIEKFTDRSTHKEHSAIERELLMGISIDKFQDSPIHGNGLFYLAKQLGASSHNQILEILCNFGLIGFFVYLAFYLAFYHKNDFAYLALCIFPSMFFSHNFFENSALQVSLGFAYLYAKSTKTKFVI